MANVSKRLKARGNNRDEDGAMGVSLLEQRRNEEILAKARMESIAMVMRGRRFESFGHVKRRVGIENIRAVGSALEDRCCAGRDMKAWNIKINSTTFGNPKVQYCTPTRCEPYSPATLLSASPLLESGDGQSWFLVLSLYSS